MAQRRFAELGYDNVDLRMGDGSHGWPEAAPFDAILMAAGAPGVPDALKEQLAIGGRLVIPVGEELSQTLLKITRKDTSSYQEESLAGVAFVPLVGERGWAEDGRRAASDHLSGQSRGRAGPPFRRFPTWTWRNTDVAAFVDWMRPRNESIPEPERRAGFNGLDIHNMSASIAAVLDYLDRVDPEAARVARERYGCLTPWQREPSTYGRAVLTAGYRKCRQAVIEQCRELLRRRLEYAAQDGESFLDAAQNARLVAPAERYYRIMHYGGPDSWNLRDMHMFETDRERGRPHGGEPDRSRLLASLHWGCMSGTGHPPSTARRKMPEQCATLPRSGG